MELLSQQMLGNAKNVPATVKGKVKKAVLSCSLSALRAVTVEAVRLRLESYWLEV